MPVRFLGRPSGWIVDQAGYVVFFVYASALGIPAIALIIWLMSRGGAVQQRSPGFDGETE